jgi:hypothetical protein
VPAKAPARAGSTGTQSAAHANGAVAAGTGTGAGAGVAGVAGPDATGRTPQGISSKGVGGSGTRRRAAAGNTASQAIAAPAT